jgi:hypothetical protein
MHNNLRLPESQALQWDGYAIFAEQNPVEKVHSEDFSTGFCLVVTASLTTATFVRYPQGI